MNIKNIYLFHLDNEIQELFGINHMYSEKRIVEEFTMVTKVAFLLCEEYVYFPVSNYLESDTSFKILNSLGVKDSFGASFIRMASSSFNMEELLDKKLKQHGDNINKKGYHYNDFKNPEKKIYLPGTFEKREKSASEDIEKAWTSRDGMKELSSAIYKRFPSEYGASQLEDIIANVPNYLGGRAFISSYITPYFMPNNANLKSINNIINCFITREYIRSFLDEYKAVCFTDIPLLNGADLILPKGDKYKHISYKKYITELVDTKYKGDIAYNYVKRKKIYELYEFKRSPEWNDIRNVDNKKQIWTNSIPIRREQKNMDVNSNLKVEKKSKKIRLFISYKDCDTPLVDIIEKQLKEKMGDSLEIDRYTDLKYKQSFRAFMNSIQDHDYVLSIVSDAYLKSQPCMYEIGEVVKDHHYDDRLLFIVLSEEDRKYYGEKAPEIIASNIYEGAARSIEYKKYWKNKHDHLDKMIKDLDDSAASIQELEQLIILERIYKHDIGEFIAYLNDRKGISFIELFNNGFSELVEWMEKDKQEH